MELPDLIKKNATPDGKFETSYLQFKDTFKNREKNGKGFESVL